jgi:hypothetical protein
VSNRSKTVALFDHLVGKREQLRRHVEAERLGDLEVHDQLYLHHLLDRQIFRSSSSSRNAAATRAPGVEVLQDRDAARTEQGCTVDDVKEVGGDRLCDGGDLLDGLRIFGMATPRPLKAREPPGVPSGSKPCLA